MRIMFRLHIATTGVAAEGLPYLIVDECSGVVLINLIQDQWSHMRVSQSLINSLKGHIIYVFGQ